MTMNQLPEQSDTKAAPQKKPWGKLIAFLFLVVAMIAIARHYFSGVQDAHVAASPAVQNSAPPVLIHQFQRLLLFLSRKKRMNFRYQRRGVLPDMSGQRGHILCYRVRLVRYGVTSHSSYGTAAATELNVDGERVTFWVWPVCNGIKG
ncbi:Uncharacterised protein [Escherichia coli]|uniref:hypothetical protein n=1 Tax=Escherichia coli TaxID=562 RepID=UPI0010E04E91|nr:hypothetical protein [Escherichia coli]VTR19035.1 Uncharacterised protein [Escherichia coli]